MKKLAIYFILCLSGYISFGQDMIYKTNSDEIKSKIIEIAANEIKYKDFDFQDGPTRNIATSDVFMVIYENGKREYFTTQKTLNRNVAVSTTQQNQTVQQTGSSESQPVYTETQSGSGPAKSFNFNNTVSQFDKNKIRFAAKAGFNLCKVHQNFKNSDEESDTKIKLGIHIGGIAEYTINNSWDFQTGLSLTGKGSRYDVDGKDKLRLGYLEIPINAVYKFNDFRFIAGTYWAFGLGGKEKYDYDITYSGYTTNNNGTTKYKPKIGKIKDGDLDDNEEAYRFFDLGLNFGASYPVGPVLILANYALGLSNLTPKYDGSSSYHKDYKQHNRVFSISAIYYIDDLLKK